MSVTVNVIKLSGGRDEVELEDGATYADAASAIGAGDSVQARVGGVDITKKVEEIVEDGATITITPKSLKNGS